MRGSGGSMYSVIVQPQGGGGPVNQAPNGVINTPSGAQTIQVGQTVTFTGTGTDPEPQPTPYSSVDLWGRLRDS